MKRVLFFLIAAGCLLPGMTIYAHHSFTATYDTEKTVKIEGKIVQFLFRNPHSFLHVEGTDENGQMQTWNIEWAAAGQLGDTGVTRETLKVGDLVVITGNPGRDAADYRLRMVTLRRTTDGVSWGFRPGQVVQ